jgi:hypothetical protein
MFDCFSFVMQELKEQKEHLLVSRNSVFVFVLLLTCVHFLSQPECFGVISVFDVIMRSALQHGIFKALPAWPP